MTAAGGENEPERVLQAVKAGKSSFLGLQLLHLAERMALALEFENQFQLGRLLLGAAGLLRAAKLQGPDLASG